MSEKFKLDHKIGFQNTLYTKCINVIIDSIGPSIILRSILYIKYPIKRFLVYTYSYLNPHVTCRIERKVELDSLNELNEDDIV